MIVNGMILALALTMVGSFPAWPYSRGWGYAPASGVAIILALVIVLLLLNVV